jgi:hypothetical protein
MICCDDFGITLGIVAEDDHGEQVGMLQFHFYTPHPSGACSCRNVSNSSNGFNLRQRVYLLNPSFKLLCWMNERYIRSYEIIPLSL